MISRAGELPTLDVIDFTFCSATVDRSEPESLIHEFMTLTRFKIDCIRYDGAAEFAKSATFKAFCVNNRIAMEETAAYTHTNNARAEGAVVRIVKNTCGVCYAAQTSHVTFGHMQCCTFAASMLTVLARQARQKCVGEIGCSWAACALPR